MATAADSHGLRSDVSLTLEVSENPQILVQLHQGTIAPQIVLENRSGQRLEILDSRGQAFLRLDTDGVAADTASPEWRAVLNPLNAVSAPASAGAPRWKKIRRDPSYGWFDLRLNPEPVIVPKELVLLGQSAPIHPWTIPARLNGKPYEIRGQFVYQPPPRGHVQARLRPTNEFPPGLQLQLADGRTPALFLHNGSKQTVQVLDEKNQPLHTIKPGQRKTWLEPRAAYRGAPPAGPAAPATLGEWRVPMTVGQQPHTIHGVHQWVPLTPTQAKK